jgi:protocatechuate 3,4-dioxygenase alpha subunit
MTLPLTPSQTVGPFFAIGLGATVATHAVPDGTPGEVRISGQVFDGDGQPIRDALVETWQPEGVARCATDDEGQFAIVAVKPSPGTAVGSPHLDISVFARGILTRLVTRCSFPDESAANESDAVLRTLTDEERATLVAVVDGAGLRFDIHLQGARETVFYDR